jgi:phosphoribosylformylglycinamidine synthase
MPTFDVFVEVTHKTGISDPQGATIERALPALGFDGIEGVHVGKAFRFSMEAADQGAAEARVGELCQRFLTNPVIEDSRVTVSPAAS